MKNLELLNLQELQELKIKIESLIQQKIAEESKEFAFEFEATNDPRKGKPYVARLYWDAGKLQREFMDLVQTWGRKEITVSGEYRARSGDIIEKRTGGSWKNDYRDWYLISDEGEEIHVANIDDSSAKGKVQQYLQGKITKNELIKMEG